MCHVGGSWLAGNVTKPSAQDLMHNRYHTRAPHARGRFFAVAVLLPCASQRACDTARLTRSYCTASRVVTPERLGSRSQLATLSRTSSGRVDGTVRTAPRCRTTPLMRASPGASRPPLMTDPTMAPRR